MSARIKRRLLRLLPFFRLFFLGGFIFSFFFLFWRFVFPLVHFAAENKLSPRFFWQCLWGKENLAKNFQGRTNLVILGIGGGEHSGGDLTDTIIFLSLAPFPPDVFLLSIPRDLWIPTLQDRINSAYHYGEEKKKGSGLIFAKSVVEEVVGQPVHYGVILDFSGFKKIIDYLGGIEIYVEESFEDKFYPIPGKENDFCGGDPSFSCRFETVSFAKGWQRMDGEKALKYVRSRHAVGPEGTDFARSKRQQQVIFALKEKVFHSFSFWQLRSLIKLASLFQETMKTDMDWSEKIFLAYTFFRFPREKFRGEILKVEDKEKKINGLLVNPPLWEYNGAWVLVPKEGSFAKIHQYVSCQIKRENCQEN